MKMDLGTEATLDILKQISRTALVELIEASNKYESGCVELNWSILTVQPIFEEVSLCTHLSTDISHLGAFEVVFSTTLISKTVRFDSSAKGTEIDFTFVVSKLVAAPLKLQPRPKI
jgi:hypothetical protein